MRIIVPMAGMGKRMRPHTLTVPKPLLKVAGKPIVQRLMEDITKVVNEKVEEIAYVIGDFGKEVEEKLIEIAKNLGAKGSIYYQDEPLGTAHAILCAADSLKGNVVIAFADTLFKADFKLDTNKEDGIIWVNKIDDPRAFGVVKISDRGYITDFVEKPQHFVSDLAIIGIYYFEDGENLRKELQYLIDNDIKDKGEYQITNALQNMTNKGKKFVPGRVDEWLDCGNKDATVYTNQKVLEFIKQEKLVSDTVKLINSVIVPPCFIDTNVTLENSVVGPYVSLGENCRIKNAVISNSIIQENAKIEAEVITNSMLGSNVELKGTQNQYSIGDYSFQEK
ncbi:MAG: sugar phosphate nucleotidyltransferase [Bacteroidia bacterium]